MSTTNQTSKELPNHLKVGGDYMCHVRRQQKLAEEQAYYDKLNKQEDILFKWFIPPMIVIALALPFFI